MKAQKIRKFDPCIEALDYLEKCESYRQAWENCKRGDWMLWICSKLKIDKQKLFLAKGMCAKTVSYLMQDQRSIKAVEAAINYGKGLVSQEDLKKIAHNAYAAYTSDAAYAYEAYTSDAADDDTHAPAYAAADAYIAYAADDVTHGSAYAAAQIETANICKEILTEEFLTKIK